MTIINANLITEAVFNLCKQANVYVTKDVYNALFDSYKKEINQNAKNVLLQILENIEIAAKNQRPICQDTGMVVIFAQIGRQVQVVEGDFEKAVNNGVEKAYKECFFRKSIVKSPVNRENTQTNTPAIIHTELIEGDMIKLSVAIKGAGSENMSAIKMLSPADGVDGIVDFVVETVKNASSNACPPMRLGIGIGGNFEKSVILSKKALFEEIKSERLLSDLEKIIYQKTNKLEIGAGGFGGNNTIYGVNILEFPTHIASLPVAVNINCHASRHAGAEVLTSGIKYDFENFQTEFEHIATDFSDFQKIDSTEIDKIRTLKKGDKVLLTGEIYTARDKAHQKIFECIEKNEKLPFDIKNKIIFYAGPCPATKNEIIGPIGPTTSKRMDKYTPILYENGLLATIGKGERSLDVEQSIKNHNGIYFIAVGGTASFFAEKITEAKVIAYEEFGPEAIFKLRVKNLPLFVNISN